MILAFKSFRLYHDLKLGQICLGMKRTLLAILIYRRTHSAINNVLLVLHPDYLQGPTLKILISLVKHNFRETDRTPFK